MPGAVFAEVGVWLFVAGTAFRDILGDSRSAKCCIFQYKIVSKIGRVRSPKRRVRDDDFILGSWSESVRIVFLWAEAIHPEHPILIRIHGNRWFLNWFSDIDYNQSKTLIMLLILVLILLIVFLCFLIFLLILLLILWLIYALNFWLSRIQTQKD